MIQITKAIKKFGFEKIRERTERFAEAWQGETDLRFCPHPTTFYADERFDDDPSTWQRRAEPQKEKGDVGQLRENLTCKRL